LNQFGPKHLRQTVLDMAYSGQTVHIGCAFSIIELLSVLYAKHLRLDIANPRWPDRDFLVLSKGHGVMAQYACLRELGWLSGADLEHYFSNGTLLKGLADVHVPGIEATTGSLGHGLSVGAGLALGAKLQRSEQVVYALVGDGELNEGSIWEAVQFAVQFRLDNLLIIVDQNGFQAMGATDDVMQLGDLTAKFRAFGFDADLIDGHDMRAIDAAYSKARADRNGRPKAIVARTVKGKGVSFMEGNNAWHYTRLDEESYAKATSELK